MFADKDRVWGSESRETMKVLSPSPRTFLLETLFPVSRAFRAVSAAVGRPATGFLKRGNGQTIAIKYKTAVQVARLVT